jgi:hypothetical protein
MMGWGGLVILGWRKKAYSWINGGGYSCVGMGCREAYSSFLKIGKGGIINFFPSIPFIRIYE